MQASLVHQATDAEVLGRVEEDAERVRVGTEHLKSTTADDDAGTIGGEFLHDIALRLIDVAGSDVAFVGHVAYGSVAVEVKEVVPPTWFSLHEVVHVVTRHAEFTRRVVEDLLVQKVEAEAICQLLADGASSAAVQTVDGDDEAGLVHDVFVRKLKTKVL